MTCSSAVARAHPNIALVKYWGKRDTRLNLPAAGSVSVTLDTLETVTEVHFDPGLEQDVLILNDRVDRARLPRASQCLDRLRDLAGDSRHARIESRNNFPTAAGLASSASGFAALVTAASAALKLELSGQVRSIHARQGSGSAARSIFGGFVRMHAGHQENGGDAFAEQLMSSADWPLSVVVGVTNRSAKKHASTEGMEHTRKTSPFYSSWVETTTADVDEACRIIQQRDFQALAELAEHSCLKMHAVMMASQPGLMYFNATTMAGLHRVRELRASGVAAFFSVDAGPQIKVVCQPNHAERVVDALEDLAGIQDVMVTGLGGPAVVLESPP